MLTSEGGPKLRRIFPTPLRTIARLQWDYADIAALYPIARTPNTFATAVKGKAAALAG